MIISILGCGWLGFPLAKHLVHKGHVVKGSTTSKEKLELLQAESIAPFLIRLTPELETPKKNTDFWNANVLVLNIPPGRKRDDVIELHIRQILSVKKAVINSPIEFVIFVSSTSVYPKFAGAVGEADTMPGKAGSDSGNALLQAEKILLQNPSFETTVIRFGGLTGGNRNPVKYMTGKKDLPNGNAPVNMIHRDDCIAIISQIIEEKITGEIFNAVSDDHSARKEYYTQAAKNLNLKPPTFSEDRETNHKLVKNDKLKSRLGYIFT
ncbi:MAG TPA: SDR family oxidoreductase [Flavobacteriaceae bacterium]|nr:SDR family oxidoreductase [Flavobacteriaceae bacterium]